MEKHKKKGSKAITGHNFSIGQLKNNKIVHVLDKKFGDQIKKKRQKEKTKQNSQ